jgi:hypothetical protein
MNECTDTGKSQGGLLRTLPHLMHGDTQLIREGGVGGWILSREGTWGPEQLTLPPSILAARHKMGVRERVE